MNGQKVTEERSVMTAEDPCVTCKCNNGRLNCVKKACPVLHCPLSRIVHEPGECCPRCKGLTRYYIFLQNHLLIDMLLFFFFFF